MITRLIHNANILSFHDNSDHEKADCIAVSDNVIEAVGKYEELKSLIHSDTQVIDANRQTIMPGFNDTHIHIWKVGNLKTFMLDVRGAESKAELLQLLNDYYHNNPHLQWITARGFNEAGWREKAMPTSYDLDMVIKDKPVYLIRTCAHIAVCNSKALQMANIDEHTICPAGGFVQLGANGKPTGIITETALGLVANRIPPYSVEDLKIMIRASREEMYRYGITAATDPAVNPVLMTAYKEINNEEGLGMRINLLPVILPDGGIEPYPIPRKFNSAFLNINTVKFFADGGLSGKTAALKRFYKSGKEQGILRLDKNIYAALCRQCMEHDLGIATHAIGDAAIEMVIEVYQQLNINFPFLIKRIEHLGLPEKKHLEAMVNAKIACSMQAIFLDELGKNFTQYLEEDYLEQCYPIRSVLAHNILMSLSSDAPVVKNFNPLKGITAAHTRKTSDGIIIAPQESIAITAALKAYTHSGAQISGEERFGSLQKGLLADFIMLDKNPLNTPVEDIACIKVTSTFVDGKEVWRLPP